MMPATEARNVGSWSIQTRVGEPADPGPLAEDEARCGDDHARGRAERDARREGDPCVVAVERARREPPALATAPITAIARAARHSTPRDPAEADEARPRATEGCVDRRRGRGAACGGGHGPARCAGSATPAARRADEGAPAAPDAEPDRRAADGEGEPGDLHEERAEVPVLTEPEPLVERARDAPDDHRDRRQRAVGGGEPGCSAATRRGGARRRRGARARAPSSMAWMIGTGILPDLARVVHAEPRGGPVAAAHDHQLRSEEPSDRPPRARARGPRCRGPRGRRPAGSGGAPPTAPSGTANRRPPNEASPPCQTSKTWIGLARVRGEVGEDVEQAGADEGADDDDPDAEADEPVGRVAAVSGARATRYAPRDVERDGEAEAVGVEARAARGGTRSGSGARPETTAGLRRRTRQGRSGRA